MKRNREMVYFWRAVDHEVIPEGYITETCDKDAVSHRATTVSR